MYRDEYERCPRCHAELVDAGSVRQCTACNGQWVTHEVIMEMATNMTRPDRPEMKLFPEERARLACPTCGIPMATFKLHHIEIDRCHNHGIWFDRDELETVLYAVSRTGA